MDLLPWIAFGGFLLSMWLFWKEVNVFLRALNILAILISAYWSLLCWLIPWNHRAEFGDAWGGLTSLFTGATLAGIVYSIYREHRDKVDLETLTAYKELLERVQKELEQSPMESSRKTRLIREEAILDGLICRSILDRAKNLNFINKASIISTFHANGFSSKKQLESEWKMIKEELDAFGIVTNDQLESFVSNLGIRDNVESIYSEVLHRSAESRYTPHEFVLCGGYFFRAEKGSISLGRRKIATDRAINEGYLSLKDDVIARVSGAESLRSIRDEYLEHGLWEDKAQMVIEEAIREALQGNLWPDEVAKKVKEEENELFAPF